MRIKKSVWLALALVWSGGAGLQAQSEIDPRKKGLRFRPPSSQKPAPIAPGQARHASVPPSAFTSLAGRVTDEVSAEPLAGVVVKIAELNVARYTDYDGAYSFPTLPPGAYKIEVDLISYQKKIVQNVVIRNNKTTRADLTLKENVLTTETVVVEAELTQASDAAMLSLQKNSLQISDGYSGQMALRETGDLSTNVTLRRLPGVTLIEDKILFVRGLHERYNNITFNGALMPASDLDRPIFDFSLLPANLISGLRLVKSATADALGAMGGGYVQFQTIDLPQKNSLRVWAQGGYHSLATFKTHRTQPTDGGLFPTAPDFTPSDFLNASAYNHLPLDAPERMALARKTRPNFAPNEFTAPPNVSVGFNLQRKVRLAGREAGFVAYAAYNNEYAQFLQTYNIVGKYDSERGVNPVNDSSDNRLSTRRSTFLTMLNGGIKLGKGGKLALRNLAGYSVDNGHSLYGYGFDVIQGIDIYKDNYTSYLGLNQQFQKNYFYVGQAAVEYAFNAQPRAPRFSADVSYSYLQSDMPNYAYSNYRFDSTQGKWIFDYQYFSKNEIDYATIVQSQLKNQLLGGNLRLDFHTGKPIKWTAGAFFTMQARTYRSRYFTYIPANYISEDDSLQFNIPANELTVDNIGTLFKPTNFAPDKLSLFEKTGAYNAFDAQSFNFAPFMMTDIRANSVFRINVGLRYEYFRRQIDLRENSAISPFLTQLWREILPSATIMWNLSEKTLLRAAYFHTVSRPSERDAVPLPYLTFLNGVQSIGNPALTYTRIRNCDLRFEWYPSGVEVVSVSLFYKYFISPIEQKLAAINDFNVLQYVFANSDRAQVMGLEGEFRLKLSTLAPLKYFGNFTIYANGALMRSAVGTGGPDVLFSNYGTRRQLQGQANYTLNMGLIFKEPKTKLDLALFYNRVGERVAVVGLGDTIFPNFYELPRDVIELQIGRSLGERFYIRFQVSDLLAQPFRWVQIYDGRKDYRPERDRLIQNIRRGTTAQVTLSYQF